MRISILAGSQSHPVGGVTSRYEYANRLCRRGHEVNLVHFSWLRPCVRGLDEVGWFRFEEGIRHVFHDPPAPLALPDADFVTDDRFAERHGLPFHLFQGTQPFLPAALDSFYRARGPKVCVARWLVDEALAHGVPADELVHIPHGIDHDRFSVRSPIEGRPPRVAMLHHSASIKGTRWGIAALEEVRRRVPDVEVVLFGTQEPAQRVPAWMTVVRSPSPRVLVDEVYNASAVLLAPNLWGEGFGKTSVEAMACGCALVTTANGGSGDFAFHGETALVCEPRDVAAMADHVVELLGDEVRRVELARRGAAYVRRFDWDESARRLEALLTEYGAHPERYLSGTSGAGGAA